MFIPSFSVEDMEDQMYNYYNICFAQHKYH